MRALWHLATGLIEHRCEPYSIWRRSKGGDPRLVSDLQGVWMQLLGIELPREMETNCLLPPLQYCKCKTSLSLRVCVVFRGPWEKKKKKSKSCRNRQKWEGARHSCTLLTKGLPRSAPFHTAPLSNFIPVFLWIFQEVLLLGKVFEGKKWLHGK